MKIVNTLDRKHRIDDWRWNYGVLRRLGDAQRNLGQAFYGDQSDAEIKTVYEVVKNLHEKKSLEFLELIARKG